jgi:hypothetical protein
MEARLRSTFGAAKKWHICWTRKTSNRSRDEAGPYKKRLTACESAVHNRSMHWIDDNLLRRIQKQEDNQDYVTAGREILSSVCSVLRQDVEAAKIRAGIPLKPFLNGTEERIVLKMPQYPAEGQTSASPKECALDIDRASHSLVISGELNLTFPMSRTHDGTIGLTYKGKPIATARVAQMILSPLLFPDLEGDE